MRRSTALRCFCVASLATLAFGVGGCASTNRNDGGRHAAIQSNLSPELDTLTERPIDFDNRMSYTMDANDRMMWADFQRIMLLDRPSRLQPITSPF